MTRFAHRVERDLGQIADRATPSSTAWEAIRRRIDEQDNTNDSTVEVIMLSPDRNQPPNRTRTWLLAAAAVAAIALVGGLIVIANRDDDQVPADLPDVTVPVPDTAGVNGETAPVTIPMELPVTVTYVDVFDFELQAVSVSPLADDTSLEQDDDPDTDYVQAVFEITNPSTDHGIFSVSHRTLMRLTGPGVGAVSAERVWNEAHEQQTANLGLDPGQSVVRQWSFPVPAGIDPSTLTIRIGIDGEAGPLIDLAGPAPATASD